MATPSKHHWVPSPFYWWTWTIATFWIVTFLNRKLRNVDFPLKFHTCISLYFKEVEFVKQNQSNKINLKKYIIYKKLTDLSKDWTQVTCLAVNHSNHYTLCLCETINWFMHGWFCSISLIHLIRWKSRFEIN